MNEPHIYGEWTVRKDPMTDTPDPAMDEWAQQLADLTSHRIEGIAFQGNTAFTCPIVTQVEGNLWQGGTPADAGGNLPGYFRYVLNLYPWESYWFEPLTTEMKVQKLQDASHVPDEDLLYELATWVNEKRALGPTLVHCQAGLNRSALVTGLALIVAGAKPNDAIQLLRQRRSPAVLCNRTFERWLQKQEPGGRDA